MGKKPASALSEVDGEAERKGSVMSRFKLIVDEVGTIICQNCEECGSCKVYECRFLKKVEKKIASYILKELKKK